MGEFGKSGRARVIAFYLPQYHPITENDEWWGKGFTEWTVVCQAKSLFRGHYQPHIPADLGFYDLRVPETREAQAQLARDHGIEGFCYWHYWLGNKRRLLERPFQEVLTSGEPDYPFCLGWANHSWVGVFFGAKGRMLVEQKYPGLEDHKEHFSFLLSAFADQRYMTVEGKPLFHILRPWEIPDVKRVIELWRELAHRAGLQGLHVVGEGLTLDQVTEFGFDAASYSFHRLVEKFLPRNRHVRQLRELYRRMFRKPSVYTYEEAMQFFLRRGESALNEYPSLVPNWDSTPRLGWEGVVLRNATPQLFRLHVREALEKSAHKPVETRIIFVKSWNEWAEGNHLEPDQRYGKAHLEALRDELVGE